MPKTPKNIIEGNQRLVAPVRMAALGIWIYAWRTAGLPLKLRDFGRIAVSGALMSAGVLAFIGLNMIGDYAAAAFFDQPAGVHLIPTWAKLAVIAVLLAASIAASVVAKRRSLTRR